MKGKLALSFVLTLLGFSLATGAAFATEDAGDAQVTQNPVLAPTSDASGPSEPETIEAGIPEPVEQCGSCTGTLGLYVDPSCQTCNVNETACRQACSSRGGVAVFQCGGGGIYCECNDGAYDDCTCVD